MLIVKIDLISVFQSKGQSMKKRHFFISLMALTCTVFLFGGCNNTKNADSGSESSAEMPVITVGCDDYQPFSYIDTNGEVTGIDVELAKEAFGRMGYKPEFTMISWESKNDLLNNGDIDCIWSSFTMDGREDEYAWAGPYMRSKQVIAVNADSDIYTLQDLKGKLIAVQSTTKPEEILRAHGDGIPDFKKIISVKKRDLIFTMLGKGYVDAAAAHITAVEQFMKDCDISFRVLDEPLLNVGLGTAFRLDDKEFASTLDSKLKEMNNDGTTEQIISRYLSDPEQYLEVNSGE